MRKADASIAKEAVISNELGLHARSAAMIAKLAQGTKAKIWLAKGNEKADATSIIDMLSLVCPKGTKIRLRIDDPADEGILDQIIRLIEDGFGE